jgi:hypothetical protein
MFALPQVSIPPRKQLGAAEPDALADLIRIGQGLCDPLPVLRQQIWMAFGNVTLPLLCQVDIAFQVGTRKLARHGSPFNIKSLTLRLRRGRQRE